MISVVIPIYNGESHIKRCLDSLLAASGILEIIAINDGSTDGTSDILSEYAAKYPVLKVINKSNAGAAQARKTGIEIAKGKYIGFVDIDDYVTPTLYEEFEKKARETNADIIICDFVEIHSTHMRSVKNQFDKTQEFPLSPIEAMSYMNRRKAYFTFPWNKIYKASLLRSIEYPTKNFVGEDYNMHLQLLHKGATVEYLNVEGYHYVITESSASRSGFGPNTILAFEHYKKDYEWVKTHHPEQTKETTHYLMIEFLAIIVPMGRNKTYDKSIIKQIKKFVLKGCASFLLATYVPLKMKASALSVLISYRLLIFMYKIFNR